MMTPKIPRGGNRYFINSPNKNQAFLILCNNTTDPIIGFYKCIVTATRDMGDTVVAFHQKEQKASREIEGLDHVAFTDAIVTKSNYIPIGFNLVPGNNHFPLLQFYLDNPGYDYYWCIEEDVRFSGDWAYFFETFSATSHDFISSHLRTSSEEPQWHWWHTLANPYSVIPFERRLRSFNPIYRLSRAALAFIHRSLRKHWCGHHEVLLPTLLNEEGFEILDFGGTGSYVLPGFENKFYIDNTSNQQGILADGTMRWRPAFDQVGDLKDKLYHPVKGPVSAQIG